MSGDFPVNSQLITCKSYILFNAISTCVPKVRNYGDFRQHVIPTIITCMLRGTPCYTGIYYTFYGENICSVQPIIIFSPIVNGDQSLCTASIPTMFSKCLFFSFENWKAFNNTKLGGKPSFLLKVHLFQSLNHAI